MPRMQLLDDFGTSYTITSSNPATIGAWLAEVCNIICSANSTINHPVRLDVWPMFVMDKETGRMEPDWVPGGVPFIFQPHQMHKLVDLLNGIADIPAPPAPPEPESEQLRKHPESFGADHIQL